MTDVARVRLRNITLAESARILSPQGGPDGAESFLALDAPPPVGSVLTWEEDGGTPRAARVLRVVESGGEHGVAGVYVAPASEEELARSEQVGTEHLAPMERPRPQDDAAGARSDDGGDEADGPAPQAGGFAVPAPVVEPEPSEPIDVGPPGQDPAQGPAAPESRARSGKRRKGRRRG